MSVPTDAILRVVVSLLAPESVIMQNVFYTLFKNTGGSDDEADVLSDLKDWIEDLYATLNVYMDADVVLSLLQCYLRDVPGGDWDEVGIETLTDSFAGSVDLLPHGAAAVVHAKTTNPDRQATKYFGGFSETAQNESKLVAPLTTALIAAGVEWVTDYVGAATGSTFDPGVWSPTDLVFYSFSGTVDISNYIGYQRRRKPGVGS